jgi:hypothetical protein
MGRNWKSLVTLFTGLFAGALAFLYLFVLLIDPYDIVPLSLPLDRRIVSINQRYMYPQIARSGRFDSLLTGTSTAQLIDPRSLNGPFVGRFANLAMDSMRAWEQMQIVDLFSRANGPPNNLIIALDSVWCERDADRERITFRGFPDWLYDDNEWNDYLYLLNVGTIEIAVRQLGYQLGLYRERVRYDGFRVFTPPEASYDAARARQHLWKGRTPHQRPQNLPPPLSADERQELKFPALAWLEAILAKQPSSTRRMLAYMPVHVAAQPWPGSAAASIEEECKARIDKIAQKHGAAVVDWRINSPITREDRHYWDPLHYRLPVAQLVARQLGDAIEGRDAEDGSYVMRVRGTRRGAQ